MILSSFTENRTWKIRLKDGDSVVVKIDPRDRERRIAADSNAFYVTDHYLNYPMMIIRLSAVDDDTLRELLSDAWKHAAE